MDRNTVLLVDSDAKVRRLLRAGCELGGYNVIESENAAEGLQIAISKRPDLIILEPAPPDLAGAEVLERFRSWSNVPIIILSVVSSEDQKVRLLRAGADDYMIKPFGMAGHRIAGLSALEGVPCCHYRGHAPASLGRNDNGRLSPARRMSTTKEGYYRVRYLVS